MKEKTKEIILKYLEESSTDVLERFSKNLFEKNKEEPKEWIIRMWTEE